MLSWCRQPPVRLDPESVEPALGPAFPAQYTAHCSGASLPPPSCCCTIHCTAAGRKPQTAQPFSARGGTLYRTLETWYKVQPAAGAEGGNQEAGSSSCCRLLQPFAFAAAAAAAVAAAVPVLHAFPSKLPSTILISSSICKEFLEFCPLRIEFIPSYE